MSFWNVVFVFEIMLILTINAAPDADEVIALPGWNGSLPSKMYSGYVDVGEDKSHHVHYVFIQSENEPTLDPVILWVQGGPGGSSMEGCTKYRLTYHFIYVFFFFL